MSVRNSLVPAVSSGGATAAKLLIASLAFAAAYAGVGTAFPADQGATNAANGTVDLREPGAHGIGAAAENVPGGATATVRLTTAETSSGAGEAEARPKPGVVTVNAVRVSGRATRSGCKRVYQAQTLVTVTDGVAVYHWRLQRWSAASKKWRPYMSAHAGFTDATRPVRWRPPIVANPGWYRVEIKIQPGGTYRSGGFRVTC